MSDEKWCDDARCLSEQWLEPLRYEVPDSPGHHLCDFCVRYLNAGRVRRYMLRHATSDLAKRLFELRPGPPAVPSKSKPKAGRIEPAPTSKTMKPEKTSRAKQSSKKPIPPEAQQRAKLRPCIGCGTATMSETGYCTRSCRVEHLSGKELHEDHQTGQKSHGKKAKKRRKPKKPPNTVPHKAATALQQK